MLKWNVTFGAAVTSPSVDSDGTIYVGAGDALHALYPTGLLRWSAPGSGVPTSPAIASDGTVFVSMGHSVMSLAKSSGLPLWSSDLANGQLTPPSIGLDSTLYVCSSSGTVFGFKAAHIVPPENNHFALLIVVLVVMLVGAATAVGVYCVRRSRARLGGTGITSNDYYDVFLDDPNKKTGSV